MKHHGSIAGLAILLALTIGGCDLLDPSGPLISVSYSPHPSLDVPTELRVVISGRRVQIPASTGATAPRAVQIRGHWYGETPTRVALLDAEGDTLAAVAFTHHLSRNSDHWVSARVGIERPLGFCIGTIAAARLRAPSADTLFVMYGGIPEGAIC